MNQNKIKEYFEEYKKINPNAVFGEAFQFGVDPDKLVALVISGEKTLTCSLKELYEEDDALPVVSDNVYDVVLNSKDEPSCIIKVNKVYEMKFADVDEKIAYKEGEGDKSLAYWRKSHRDFFEHELKQIAKEFDEDLIIVIEEFDLIYK